MKKNLFFILCIACTLSLSAQTKSWKRGLCMSNITAADINALEGGMTWFYDWDNAPSTIATTAADKYGLEYCPMAWNDKWNAEKIRTYVKAHPNCKYILAYNEPNFIGEACLTPTKAAADWPRLRALADELGLKIIAPATNYSSWEEWSTPKKWLDAFFKLVPIEEVDGIALHCYMGYSSALIGFVKEYIGYYNKPIWLTEFCSWDDRNGTPEAAMKEIQRKYMIDCFDYLETEPMVARYAWFMARTTDDKNKSLTTWAHPWMQLLKDDKGTLTDLGTIFRNLSSYDTAYYHSAGQRIPANQYLRMKGIYLETTDDREGEVNLSEFDKGDYLDFQIEVPEAGTSYLFFRYATVDNIRLKLSVEGNSDIELTLPETDALWSTKRYDVNLPAGKYCIRLNCAQGSGLRLHWLHASSDKDAETEENIKPEPSEEIYNLALNCPVEASSEQTYGNRLAKFAVDGKIDNNRWATEWEGANADNDRWFLVDLGDPTALLESIKIYWEAAYAKAYYIEVSNDKQVWNKVYETTQGKGGTEKLILPAETSGRYLRFKCVTRATQYGVSFYEFEVYGKIPTPIRPVLPEIEVKAYPNPVVNTLYLSYTSQVKQVSLADENGRLLFSAGNVSQIEMAGYPAGVYFLKIECEEGSVVRKIVKR